MAGLQSGKGRVMIESLVPAQYIDVTDIKHTHTQPRCDSNSRPSALCIWAAKVTIPDGWCGA